MTTQQLIEELKKYNLSSIVYAYEGERTGIGVCDKETNAFIGFIDIEYKYD